MPKGDHNPNSPSRLHKGWAASIPANIYTRKRVEMVRRLMRKGLGYDEAKAKTDIALPPNAIR